MQSFVHVPQLKHDAFKINVIRFRDPQRCGRFLASPVIEEPEWQILRVPKRAALPRVSSYLRASCP